MLSVSMPNSETPSALVETATKCLATASSAPSPASDHSRAVWALVIVSSVVKVFEEMMKRVSAGIEVARASRRSRCRRRWRRSGRSSRGWSSGAAPRRPSPGPRSEPPMPMLTTLRIGLPVWPFHSPERTRSQNAPIRSSTSWTCLTTSSPSTISERSLRHPQRHVEHRAVLGDVDALAAEHRVAALGDAPARPRAG